MKKQQWQKMAVMMAGLGLIVTGCGTTAQQAKGSNDTVKIAFYPNESASEFDQARDRIQAILAEATDKKVEVVTTTDYNIVIESIANGQVDLAFMGGEGYIEANKKNDKVQAIMTNSGASGTLDDALYYSYIAVRDEDADKYRKGDTYTLDPIKGQTFSFVSNSSTSGFKVPASAIVKQFGLEKSDDLIIDGTFFDRVLFGGSHQGSAVNLLKGDAQAAAFMNLEQYFKVAGGEANKAGMVYEVKPDAEAPFDTVRGKKAHIIQSTPVLNGPLVANKEKLSDEDIERITKALGDKKVSDDKAIFAPKDEIGLFKKEGNEAFVVIDDAFYNPLREL